MNRPEKINLTCAHCGYTWDQPTVALEAIKRTVYRGDKTVKRRVTCPNCHKWVTVEVLAEWVDHE